MQYSHSQDQNTHGGESHQHHHHQNQDNQHKQRHSKQNYHHDRAKRIARKRNGAVEPLSQNTKISTLKEKIKISSSKAQEIRETKPQDNHKAGRTN